MTTAESFLLHLRAFRRPKTVGTYRYAIDKFEAFLAGASPDANVLERFARRLFDQNLAQGTVALLTTCAGQYVAWRRRNGEPLPELLPAPLPRTRPVVKPVLRDDVLARFMDAATQEAEPYRTSLLILPLSGLRVGELCSLRLEDLRSTGECWILTVRDGKGGDREVPLLDPGTALLTAYLRDARRGLAGADQANPFVFPGRDGGPMVPHTLREHLHGVRAELQLPRLTPHLLRHTYLTLMHEAGVDPFDLQKLAGHSSIETTKGYVHVNLPLLTRRVRQVRFPWQPPAE